MTSTRRPDSRTAAMDAALLLYTFRPDASLDEVAAHARISRATLFRHFPNRSALLRAAGVHVIGRLDEALGRCVSDGGPPRERLHAALAVLVEAGLPLHAVFGLAERADDVELKDALRALDRHLEPVLDACIDAGLIASDLPAQWLDAALDGLLYAAWSAIHAGSFTPAQATDLLLRTLLHGFAPVRGA